MATRSQAGAGVVVLASSKKRSGRHVVEVEKGWPTALPSRLFAGPGPGGALVARPQSITSKKPFLALRTLGWDGCLVVHRDVAAALPPEVTAGAMLVEVDVGKRTPRLTDFVLLPIDHYLPIDREASRLESARKQDPFVHVGATIEELAFAPEVSLPPLFRLVEDPQVVVARTDIAQLLEELTGGDLRGVAGGNVHPSSIEVPDVDLPVAEAREAHRAFWRMQRGAGLQGDRGKALRHPALAVALALAIDREPRDETRGAALAHPYWAGMYALHVDRAPRDDTRAAAKQTVDGAVFYARELDLAVDDDLPARMATKKDWWDAPTIAGFVDHVRSQGARLRGGSAEAGPPRVAARDLPPVAPVPRYCEVTKGPVAPLSDELRDDVEAMTRHGFTWLELDATASPSDVVDAVHAAVREIQSGERKLPAGKARTQALLGMACALADALHRGLGWQWATVAPGGIAAVVSPDGAHGVVPLAPITRLAKKGHRENTVALLFNMIAAGDLPPRVRGNVSFIS